MSANNKDKDKNTYLEQSQHSSCMTPSIITTINNTSPTPLMNTTCNSVVNTNSTNTTSKNKRPAEPFYESYIEDSFVGHWEREDDDPENEYQNHDGKNPNEAEEDETALHPSTIEFDFDSFGPESFIYTPARQQTNVNKDPNKNGTQKVPERQESKLEEESSGTENTVKQQQEETKRIEESSNQSPINPNPHDYLVDTAQIDLRVIEPYKKVISHAGYCHHFDPSAPAPEPGESAPAIIVFSACYLPDRSRRDYNYVMDHLFLYVLSSLHELIADDYILIYLHNTQPSTFTGSLSSKTSSSPNPANGPSLQNSADDQQHQNNLPTFNWMKRCYQMIDRKLRKNLKILYLVKPTFWLKTIVIMCKPFISAKFSKKLRFVENMEGLKKCLPVDELILPASAENI